MQRFADHFGPGLPFALGALIERCNLGKGQPQCDHLRGFRIATGPTPTTSLERRNVAPRLGFGSPRSDLFFADWDTVDRLLLGHAINV